MESITYDGTNRYAVWDFVVGDDCYTSCHWRDDNSLTIDINRKTLYINEQDTLICLDRDSETFMVCTPQQMLFLAL